MPRILLAIFAALLVVAAASQPANAAPRFWANLFKRQAAAEETTYVALLPTYGNATHLRIAGQVFTMPSVDGSWDNGIDDLDASGNGVGLLARLLGLQGATAEQGANFRERVRRFLVVGAQEEVTIAASRLESPVNGSDVEIPPVIQNYESGEPDESGTCPLADCGTSVQLVGDGFLLSHVCVCARIQPGPHFAKLWMQIFCLLAVLSFRRILRDLCQHRELRLWRRRHHRGSASPRRLPGPRRSHRLRGRKQRHRHLLHRARQRLHRQPRRPRNLHRHRQRRRHPPHHANPLPCRSQPRDLLRAIRADYRDACGNASLGNGAPADFPLPHQCAFPPL